MRPDSQAPESFPIFPAPAMIFVLLAGILFFCALPILVTYHLFAQNKTVAIGWLVALGVGGMTSRVAWSSRNVRFELSPEGLRVRNSLYAHSVPRPYLLPGEGRAVSLVEQPQLRPGLRTLGSGLLTYREGWFRLRNTDKALVFLTDWNHVVDLPTLRGYRILLSVADPEQFLAAARRMWGAPAGAGSGGPAGQAAHPLRAEVRPR